ncbi:MAG: ATP-binding protein [Deltaproteobacteria bacterium]
MESVSNPIKFLNCLVTTIRQMSIYPPRHPSILNSLKSAVSSLNIIFIDKEKLNLNVSPDKLLNIDGQLSGAVDKLVTGEFIKLLDALGVEDLVFQKGITLEELDAFVQLLNAQKDSSLKGEDINKVFAGKGITHIVARQFSYLKVEKGKEAAIGGEGAGTAGKDPVLEGLKTRVKAYCAAAEKGAGAEGRDALEKELFDMISGEIREKGKPSASARTLLRKYLPFAGSQEEALVRLREVLAGCGIAPETIEEALKKLSEVPAEGTRRKKSGEADLTALSVQLDELRGRVQSMQRQIDERDARIVTLEKESRKATDEKHRIDNIIHNLAEGMVVVDSEGKILLANTAAENLLGITAKDVGKQVRDVVRDEHLLTMTKDLAAEKEGVVEKDIEFKSSNDETKKVLRASSAVVEDKNGNTIGMVTMLNDITRQRELEKMKGDFLANVSHELRTPLVAIQKSVSLMLTKEAGEISDTQSQFLSIAERNLKRLTFLINDLLDLTKFEAGKMELKPEQVDLEKLVSDCLVSLGNWAQTKQLKLERAMAPGLPQIWADPNRLQQVVVNLVGNAIKFTPQGGTITVSGEREGDGVRIIVADTGTGIPPGELTKIFDKFYQTKQRSSADICGTGIGLAIVREIITLHGGKVWAESDGTNGAKFIFTLPIQSQS